MEQMSGYEMKRVCRVCATQYNDDRTPRICEIADSLYMLANEKEKDKPPAKMVRKIVDGM